MPAGPIDDTVALGALPSPCSGRPLPRMLQVDATFISTTELIDTTKGVNLLDGLQVVLNASKTLVRTATTGIPTTQTITTNRNVGLPQAGVTYSLNIANAADLRADLLARPSLLALDRMPATFFSGSTVSVAIAGTIGGGNLVEKPIGISLSVTPTFIDDETMLLAVKVSRSDIEGQTTTTTSFDQALHTTRNVVNSTAMLKYDQTLILSGLVERESIFTKAGIPGLRDVPVVQYLTSTAATQEAQSMLVTITPRRIVTAGQNAPAASAADPIVQDVLARMRRDYPLPPNTVSTVRALAGNRYVAQFRAGDMKADDWRAPEPLEAMFQDVRRFLYY
jgi:type II secretory pathway component GspD/PulD (secretin)